MALSPKQQLFVEAFLGEAEGNASEAARIAGYAKPGQQGHRLLKNVEISGMVKKRLDDKAMTADEVMERLAAIGRSSLNDVIRSRPQPVRAMVLKPVREIIPLLENELTIERQIAKDVGFDGDEAEEKKHKKLCLSIQRRIARLKLMLDNDPDAVDEVEGPWEEQQVAYVDLDLARQLGKLELVKSYNAKEGRVELYSALEALEKIGKIHGMFRDVVDVRFNPEELTDEQLERIKAGEDPAKVLDK